MARASRPSSSRPAAHAVLALVALAGLVLTTRQAEARDCSEGGRAPFEIELSDEVSSLALDHDRLYVTRLYRYVLGWGIWTGTMLSIYDLSSSATQAPLGSLEFPEYGWPLGFDVQGEFAYLAFPAIPAFGRDDPEIRVVDVSDPTVPHTMATITWPMSPNCIEIDRGRAYIGDGAGLHVVDVADPTSPSPLGSVALPAGVVSVALGGSFAYAGTLDAHLAVVDVSDPLAPVVVASLLLPDTPWDIEPRGSHAYVADGEAGLQVLDLSRPTRPRILGGVDTAGDARRVAVSGARAYVADLRESGPYGLRVIDISNSTSPAMVNSMETDVASVSVSEGRIALGGAVPAGDCAGFCYDTGYLVVAPFSAYEPEGPCALRASAAASDPVIASAASHPEAFGLIGNDPNPFNPETSIRFEVPRASRVRLEIYDARGRLVKTLEDTVLPPGRHEVSWRGRDESGEAVSSGIYIVMMESEGVRHTRKITLLK